MPTYRVIASHRGKPFIREWRRRVARTLGLLALVTLCAAIGLFLLDERPLPPGDKAFTALWNAMNLVTTLGDFTAFNRAQQLFLIGLGAAFLIVGGYALSQLGGLLTNEAAVAHRENRRVGRMLDRLAGHVVVCGFGPLGRAAANRLRQAGRDVVVVERDEEAAAEASGLGFLVVAGDATQDAVLERAGIDRAQALLVTPIDADRKLALTLMAHVRNPALKIAVTGTDTQAGVLLARAGASDVVIAEDLVADALVARLAEGGAG